jgi:hypothetical protein
MISDFRVKILDLEVASQHWNLEFLFWNFQPNIGIWNLKLGISFYSGAISRYPLQSFAG